MARLEYMRVQDKQTKHRFDILVSKFDPDIYKEVKSGPYKNHSTQPRRIQRFVPNKGGVKPPSEPSGDSDQTESEV